MLARHTSISTFNVEDHQVDLHYCKGSTRRKGILAELCGFCWVRMGKYARRQYEAFKSSLKAKLVIVLNRTGETEMKKVRIQGSAT